MPSKSKAQQRFFGMVDAYKKGEMKNASSKIKKAAKGMSMDDVKDFAETKHKGLPEKVEEQTIIRLTESDLHRIVKESVNKILNESQSNIMPYFSKLENAKNGLSDVAFNCPDIPQEIRQKIIDCTRVIKGIMNEFTNIGFVSRFDNPNINYEIQNPSIADGSIDEL